MKIFIVKLIRFSLIGVIPLSTLITSYLILDPFRVIYHYSSYYENHVNGRVDLNKDFVSTSTFNNNRENLHIVYNSFIFGNSNSIFYQISDWEKHLPVESSCYHFDAAAETLWAIDKKIEYLEKLDIKIENVLLILDYETLIQDKQRDGHLFIISPVLINYENVVEFQYTFLKSFFSPLFLRTYADFIITGKFKPYMRKNRLLNDRVLNYNLISNEIRLDYLEEMIKNNNYYTPERMEVFYKRDTVQKFFPIAIKENQQKLLNNIFEIFKNNKTNFKIIINPLYYQVKLNKKDLEYLQELFGEENVFDFSGINEITENYNNYYEAAHYRPFIAREIMNKIYKKKKE